MVHRNLLCSQLGLFVEFSPEDVLLGVEEAEDDGDLEAELLALTGEAGTTGRKPAPKGQGEFATVGAGTRWAQAGGWTGLCSQLRGAAQITWSFWYSCPFCSIPFERPSCSAHLPVCCMWGAHSFLGCILSLWTVGVSEPGIG